MIEHDLELRLVRWYEVETAGAPDAALRERILEIPEGPAPGVTRTTWWLVAAALLALGLVLGGSLVVGADLLRSTPLIERLGIDPGSVDTAALLARAVEEAGLEQGSMTQCHRRTSLSAEVCVNSDWDGSWLDRHLLVRVEPTTTEEAARLLLLDLLPQQGVSNEWEPIAPGTWVTAPIDESRTTLPWSEPPIHFAAVAVSSEPIFFIVTGPTVAEVRSLAQAVLDELRDMSHSPRP